MWMCKPGCARAPPQKGGGGGAVYLHNFCRDTHVAKLDCNSVSAWKMRRKSCARPSESESCGCSWPSAFQAVMHWRSENACRSTILLHEKRYVKCFSVDGAMNQSFCRACVRPRSGAVARQAKATQCMQQAVCLQPSTVTPFCKFHQLCEGNVEMRNAVEGRSPGSI